MKIILHKILCILFLFAFNSCDVNNTNERTKENYSNSQSQNENNNKLITLFKNKIFLKEIKSIYNQSHSSPCNNLKKAYLDSIPNYDNWYFDYYNFSKRNENNDTSKIFFGLNIIVQKKGRTGWFALTDTIVLITLKAYNEKLEKINFINKTAEEIVNTFGNNFYKIDDCVIYKINNEILVLKINENIVKQLMIVKLRKNIILTDQVYRDLINTHLD